MSAFKLAYLKWLINLAESTSNAIDKIHRHTRYNADESQANLAYDLHRRRMLNRYHEKPCLCDLHNYSRARMFYIRPDTWCGSMKLSIARGMIKILRRLAMAIISLIKWTQVDCPVHYPSFMTSGLHHEK